MRWLGLLLVGLAFWVLRPTKCRLAIYEGLPECEVTE